MSVFRLLQSFLAGAVELVLAQDPPTQPCHSKGGDQERDAHPKPSGHPFANQNDHAVNYPQSELTRFREARVLSG